MAQHLQGQECPGYVANGEIGMVVGPYRRRTLASSTGAISRLSSRREILQPPVGNPAVPAASPGKSSIFLGKSRACGALRRHGLCLRRSTGMWLSCRLHSSTALAVVLWLFGSTTLPLALCAFEGTRARCAAEMPRRSSSHEGCHRSESEQPSSSVSCCCDAKDAEQPASTPETPVKADAALNASDAVIVAGPSASDRWRHVQLPALLILRPPLFTLFSTYLI